MRAIGRTSSRPTGESLSATPPSITVPVDMIVLAWPSMVVSWPRPMVPPAPGMLTTWALLTMLFVRMACCCSRTNVSQPPPAPAGAMRVMLARRSDPPLADWIDRKEARPITAAATTPGLIWW